MHLGPPFGNCLPGKSYSSLHSGWSLAWDHFCGIIAIGGHAVADVAIGDSADPAADRCVTH